MTWKRFWSQQKQSSLRQFRPPVVLIIFEIIRRWPFYASAASKQVNNTIKYQPRNVIQNAAPPPPTTTCRLSLTVKYTHLYYIFPSNDLLN